MAKPSVAVVTATTGRRELQQTIDSVAAQTYPCAHYIFVDGVTLSPDIRVPANAKVCALPFKTGANGYKNAAIVAASAFLVQEDAISWLDDDNWFEPDHIESLVEAKKNVPYAYSLRQIRKPDGSFVINDDFESIGHFGNFIDLNCYLMDRGTAIKIAPFWYKSTGDQMVGDKYVYSVLKQSKLESNGTGLYTLNYRLTASRDYTPHFFFGSIQARAKFPDGFPWARNKP